MREIRAATMDECFKLCNEVQLHPTSQFRAITLLVDGEPVVIVGYDNWTEGSVAMHQWIKHPRYVGRDILREAFRYPFENGIETVLATVRGDNPAALEVDRKIGFQPVAVVPNGYGRGVDLHILSLPRHNCKWYHR